MVFRFLYRSHSNHLFSVAFDFVCCVCVLCRPRNIVNAHSMSSSNIPSLIRFSSMKSSIDMFFCLICRMAHAFSHPLRSLVFSMNECSFSICKPTREWGQKYEIIIHSKMKKNFSVHSSNQILRGWWECSLLFTGEITCGISFELKSIFSICWFPAKVGWTEMMDARLSIFIKLFFFWRLLVEHCTSSALCRGILY